MAKASETAFAPAVTVLLRFAPYSNRDDRETASKAAGSTKEQTLRPRRASTHPPPTLAANC